MPIQRVHNINEDYDHYAKRRGKEDRMHTSLFLIVIGLVMLAMAYFLKAYFFGFIGIILIIICFFLFRSELSPNDRITFNKYYPIAFIILAIIIAIGSAYLSNALIQPNNDKSAVPIFNFIYLIAGIIFWIGLIIIIIRYAKSKRSRKKHRFN